MHGDDDEEAFANPGSPDTSACDPAAGGAGKAIRIDYTASTITTTTPGVLDSSNTVTVETLDSRGLVVSRAVTGKTKNLDGALQTETRTTTTTYDNFGRITREDGPRANSVAFDVVDTTYYDAATAGTPNDLARPRTVTRYIGTATSNIPLITTYSEYDRFGIAHRVVDASGQRLSLADSSNRQDWTLSSYDSTNTLIGTTRVTLNPSGTARKVIDGDGVCLTYEYNDANAVVALKRSGATPLEGCGVLPIDRNVGEVEVRTYVYGEPERLQSIERRRDC